MSITTSCYCIQAQSKDQCCFKFTLVLSYQESSAGKAFLNLTLISALTVLYYWTMLAVPNAISLFLLCLLGTAWPWRKWPKHNIRSAIFESLISISVSSLWSVLDGKGKLYAPLSTWNQSNNAVVDARVAVVGLLLQAILMLLVVQDEGGGIISLVILLVKDPITAEVWDVFMLILSPSK